MATIIPSFTLVTAIGRQRTTLRSTHHPDCEVAPTHQVEAEYKIFLAHGILRGQPTARLVCFETDLEGGGTLPQATPTRPAPAATGRVPESNSDPALASASRPTPEPAAKTATPITPTSPSIPISPVTPATPATPATAKSPRQPQTKTAAGPIGYTYAFIVNPVGTTSRRHQAHAAFEVLEHRAPLGASVDNAVQIAVFQGTLADLRLNLANLVPAETRAKAMAKPDRLAWAQLGFVGDLITAVGGPAEADTDDAVSPDGYLPVRPAEKRPSRLGTALAGLCGNISISTGGRRRNVDQADQPRGGFLLCYSTQVLRDLVAIIGSGDGDDGPAKTGQAGPQPSSRPR